MLNTLEILMAYVARVTSGMEGFVTDLHKLDVVSLDGSVAFVATRRTHCRKTFRVVQLALVHLTALALQGFLTGMADIALRMEGFVSDLDVLDPFISDGDVAHVAF